MRLRALSPLADRGPPLAVALEAHAGHTREAIRATVRRSLGLERPSPLPVGFLRLWRELAHGLDLAEPVGVYVTRRPGWGWWLAARVGDALVVKQWCPSLRVAVADMLREAAEDAGAALDGEQGRTRTVSRPRGRTPATRGYSAPHEATP